MVITASIRETRMIRWQDPNLTWGFVPTMGYLHEGHLSLVKRASDENDRLAVSIYVNPTQFAPYEDLDNYPRDLERDLRLLRAEGVDLVFTPSDDTIYPPGFRTYITVADISELLEGASRPTHFRGVTTIVAKLLNIIQPRRAYFGQKDAQQAIVLKRMVQDLNFNVELIVCPIIREEDGLAQSSRNKYLTPEQRKAAPVLHRALNAAFTAFEKGEHSGDNLKQLMRAIISKEPLAQIDYVSVADPDNLTELEEVTDRALVSVAAYIGDTRLIDNVLISSHTR